MTDRISISALREHGRSAPFSDDDTMAALLDAVEAANAAKVDCLLGEPLARLLAALDRFDFGDDA